MKALAQISHFVGTPTIHPALFVLSKVAVFGSWVLALLRRFDVWAPSTRLPALPGIAAVLALLGLVILAVALAALGLSTRVGLPAEGTRLRTDGIYRFSRNPMYVAVYLICTAAMLYAPHWSVILASLVGCVLHHRIVLAEEKFLEARFGQAWRDYRARVRRYL